MRFRDRTDAALQLARMLAWLRNRNDVIVLAIPRGGVIIADVIAESLHATLDVIAPRKLGAPHNPELAIGAVMQDGSSYINEYVINALGIKQEYIKEEIEAQVKEIERRLTLYRKSTTYELEDKTVVIVDDGIATGATMMVAIRWIKKQKPKMIILAIPVAPNEIIRQLSANVDKTIALHTPAQFGAVGEFYEDFSQLSDEEVLNIIGKYRV